MKMENEQKYVFLLGGHDAEMLEIRNILEGKGLSYFDKDLSWGAKLSEYGEEIKTLPEDVTPVFIELELDCPYPQNAIIIDHHNDMAGKGKPTSIEQVAALLGVELNREQQLIAANDRGHIDAMLELCATRDEIGRIRKLDQDAQGVTGEDRKLAKRAIEENLEELTPDAVMIDALSEKVTPIFDMLYDKYTHIFVITPEEKLFYTGPGRIVEALKEAMKERKKKGEKVEYWFGGNLPRKGYFGCNIKLNIDDMKKLVSPDIRSGLTVFHHSPLEKFNTMFLFPFYYDGQIASSKEWKHESFKIPRLEGDLRENWVLQRNYEEYIYFHDYVRSFLFPRHGTGEEGRFFSYDLGKDTAVASIEFRDESVGVRTLEAIVNGIYIFTYPGNIGVLVIEIGNEHEREISGPEDEQDKVHLKPFHPVSTGDDLLLFNQMFRRIYPAYFEKGNPEQQIENKEFPVKVQIRYLSSDNVIGELTSHPTCVYLHEERIGESVKIYPRFEHHVSGLLHSFLGPESRAFPILDDRMLVYTYVAFPESIDGLPEADTAREVYFSHLLFVDNPESNFRYNPKFVKGLFSQNLYTRWLHFGTMIGFSRYSGAFQFIGHRDYLYRPFYSMYFQMFLLIVYYRARLIRFSDEVALIARKWPSNEGSISAPLRKRLRNLHTEFMRFMNVFWFVEVSNQDQGIEIFDLMRKAFKLDKMYEQLKDEIERADELVELLHSEKIERFNSAAGIIGMLLGFVAIVTGFFGMNLNKITTWGRLPWLFWVILALSVGCILVSMIVLFRFKKQRKGLE